MRESIHENRVMQPCRFGFYIKQDRCISLPSNPNVQIGIVQYGRGKRLPTANSSLNRLALGRRLPGYKWFFDTNVYGKRILDRTTILIPEFKFEMPEVRVEGIKRSTLAKRHIAGHQDASKEKEEDSKHAG
jgi:hypothetical protein